MHRRILKLLLDEFDRSTALVTNENAPRQLRVHGMRADHLSTDAHKLTDTVGGQLTNAEGDRVLNGDKK